jgi:hypothetical protein
MDVEQTAPQRAGLVARLRDVSEYSFGSDLISRMQEAAYFQQMQRAALTEAASALAEASDEIDRLRKELASK